MNTPIKLPKVIKVGAYDISIQVTPDMSEDMERRGDFCSTRYRIRIDEALLDHPVNCMEVLNHEITHAIYYVYSLGLLVDGGDETEERLVSLLSVAYMQVFRDNPKILQLYSTLL